MPGKMKLLDFAKAKGVTHTTVHRWISDGVLKESVSKMGRGFMIDSDLADKELAKNRRVTSNNFKPVPMAETPVAEADDGEEPDDDDGDDPEFIGSFDDKSIKDPWLRAKLRKERAISVLKEIDARKAMGELVEARDVEKASFELGRKVRDAIMRIPQRVAAELACETDPHQVEIMLEREIRQALEGLADGNE